jgi:hypothetical protein
LEEEERTRKREEFVRKKERAAWERSQRWRDQDDERAEDRYEYAYAQDSSRSATDKQDATDAEYAAAWATYLNAWSDVLTKQREEIHDSPPAIIPWPTLQHKPVLKSNIEAFMQRMPATNAAHKLQMLKAERVRWHPDKIQQRFGGKVDEGTMKLVTGVFQVIDAVVDMERKKTKG